MESDSGSVYKETRGGGPAASSLRPRKRLTIRRLLKPHAFSLGLGFLAVLGEAIANLLQPWPLKIVLDEVFRSNAAKTGLPQFVHHLLGADKLSMVKLACLAVLGIAL